MDRTPFFFGDNEKGQCMLPPHEISRLTNPRSPDSPQFPLDDIVKIVCGKNHGLYMTGSTISLEIKLFF